MGVTAAARLVAVLGVTGMLAAACSPAADPGARSTPQPSAGGASQVTVVVNADVFTVDPDRPWAEAFAYDAAGRILAVGDTDDVLGAAGDSPETVDAGGNLVLPGFHDPHVHVPEAGINLDLCLLPPAETVEVCASLLADCADDQPDAEWIRAAGASLFDLRDADPLPIDALDDAVPDRPVLVLDDLGHAVWINSLGLAAADIDADDPDPQGGILHRGRASGRLTGLLLEDAQQLVRNVAAPDDDTIYDGLLAALGELASNGIRRSATPAATGRNAIRGRGSGRWTRAP